MAGIRRLYIKLRHQLGGVTYTAGWMVDLTEKTLDLKTLETSNGSTISDLSQENLDQLKAMAKEQIRL